MSQTIKLSVELALEGLERTHRAHEAAVHELTEYAHETPGVAVVEATGEATDGAKGSWEPLVLSVASPTATVAIFRLWLQRDRRRSVKVKIHSGKQAPVEVEADGENISLHALQSAVEAALKAARDTRK